VSGDATTNSEDDVDTETISLDLVFSESGGDRTGAKILTFDTARHGSAR